MDFKFDSNQLGIGNDIVSSISNNLDSYKSSLKSEFNKAKDEAMEYKINLGDTIKLDSVNEGFSVINDYLDEISDSAKNMAYLACEYSEDPSEDNATVLLSNINSIRNISNPDATERVGYTALMGGAKFLEGGLEFFEDIGDCAIVLGSGVASKIFGKKKLANKWRSFAEKNLSVNLIEDNKEFEKINRYSYFDKNSVYADVFKLGGKASAAIATGRVASSIFKGVSSAKSASEVAKGASKVERVARSASTNAGLFGAKTRDNLGRGLDLKSSMVLAGASVGVGTVADKVVAPAIGEKVGEVVSSSRAGDAIRAVDETASSVFGSNSSKVKDLVKTTVDYSVKEGKAKTTGNLVKDDGNDKTTADATAQDAAGTAIDTSRSVTEKAITSSLESSGEKAVEGAIVDSAL